MSSKLEYKVVNIALGDTRAATALLNQLGMDGWDAYEAVQNGQSLVTFLKRELVGYQGPREKREEADPLAQTGEGKRGPGRPPKKIVVTTTLPGVSAEFADG